MVQRAVKIPQNLLTSGSGGSGRGIQSGSGLQGMLLPCRGRAGAFSYSERFSELFMRNRLREERRRVFFPRRRADCIGLFSMRDFYFSDREKMTESSRTQYYNQIIRSCWEHTFGRI